MYKICRIFHFCWCVVNFSALKRAENLTRLCCSLSRDVRRSAEGKCRRWPYWSPTGRRPPEHQRQSTRRYWLTWQASRCSWSVRAASMSTRLSCYSSRHLLISSFISCGLSRTSASPDSVASKSCSTTNCVVPNTVSSGALSDFS